MQLLVGVWVRILVELAKTGERVHELGISLLVLEEFISYNSLLQYLVLLCVNNLRHQKVKDVLDIDLVELALKIEYGSFNVDHHLHKSVFLTFHHV